MMTADVTSSTMHATEPRGSTGLVCAAAIRRIDRGGAAHGHVRCPRLLGGGR